MSHDKFIDAETRRHNILLALDLRLINAEIAERMLDEVDDELRSESLHTLELLTAQTLECK
jgi:hypothetical protein